MTNLTERWINIYKSKEHESYWTGTFGYKTKEEAVKDLADKKHYLTTVNIEDMLNLHTQNTKLKETISNDIFLIKSRDSEIVKLKELLKECKTPLEVYNEMFGYKTELLTKIDQILGEE